MKSFSKRSAFYALDGLVDKIGDIKVKINSGLSLHSYFSNSLIIHEEKTKEITTVKEVWICDPNYHKIR